MSNPIKEFLQMEKVAAAPGWASAAKAEKELNVMSGKMNWGDLARRGAIAAGTFAVATGANEAYSAIKDAIGRSRGFKALMAHNPALAKQDAAKVHGIYNTLYQVSPDLARDPLVANSWVNRMMYQDEYVDPKTMSDLATAQDKMTSARTRGALDAGPWAMFASNMH